MWLCVVYNTTTRKMSDDQMWRHLKAVRKRQQKGKSRNVKREREAERERKQEWTIHSPRQTENNRYTASLNPLQPQTADFFTQLISAHWSRCSFWKGLYVSVYSGRDIADMQGTHWVYSPANMCSICSSVLIDLLDGFLNSFSFRRLRRPMADVWKKYWLVYTINALN